MLSRNFVKCASADNKCHMSNGASTVQTTQPFTTTLLTGNAICTSLQTLFRCSNHTSLLVMQLAHLCKRILYVQTIPKLNCTDQPMQ